MVTNAPVIMDVFQTGKWQEKIIVEGVPQTLHVKLMLMCGPGSVGVPPMPPSHFGFMLCSHHCEILHKFRFESVL